MEPKFFKNREEFRDRLEKRHKKDKELIVGYHKVGTGRESITWPESVEEALCYGWIDGIRRKIDEGSYSIRFTPRRPKSIWSAVNIATVEKLIKEGRMKQEGLDAYERRTDNKSSGYSIEQRKDIKLSREYNVLFKKNKQAWTFFKAQAPHYKRAAIWWILSAKRETTRLKRLNELITDSEAGLKVKPLRR